MPNLSTQSLKRYFSLRRVAGLYRRKLSRRVFAQCGGVIQHGPFAGMRWLDNPNWGRSEQGVMMLGLYEQEVAANLTEAPERFQVFVDVGAADGYYAVGMLYSRKAKRSLAFELSAKSRDAIAELAAANDVADKLTILGGAAAEDFADALQQQQIVPGETMFLIDIEGGEFNLLTEDLFRFLKDSLLVVETHAHIFPDPQGELDRLRERASATHRVTAWYPGPRNPWTLKELDTYTELDRWILCSEGRTEVQHWLRFDPL